MRKQNQIKNYSLQDFLFQKALKKQSTKQSYLMQSYQLEQSTQQQGLLQNQQDHEQIDIENQFQNLNISPINQNQTQKETQNFQQNIVGFSYENGKKNYFNIQVYPFKQRQVQQQNNSQNKNKNDTSKSQLNQLNQQKNEINKNYSGKYKDLTTQQSQVLRNSPVKLNRINNSHIVGSPIQKINSMIQCNLGNNSPSRLNKYANMNKKNSYLKKNDDQYFLLLIKKCQNQMDQRQQQKNSINNHNNIFANIRDKQPIQVSNKKSPSKTMSNNAQMNNNLKYRSSSFSSALQFELNNQKQRTNYMFFKHLQYQQIMNFFVNQIIQNKSKKKQEKKLKNRRSASGNSVRQISSSKMIGEGNNNNQVQFSQNQQQNVQNNVKNQYIEYKFISQKDILNTEEQNLTNINQNQHQNQCINNNNDEGDINQVDQKCSTNNNQNNDERFKSILKKRDNNQIVDSDGNYSKSKRNSSNNNYQIYKQSLQKMDKKNLIHDQFMHYLEIESFFLYNQYLEYQQDFKLRLNYQVVNFSINKMLQQFIEIYGDRFQECEQKKQLQFDIPKEDIYIESYPGAIYIILFQLFQNLSQFSSQKVKISLKKDVCYQNTMEIKSTLLKSKKNKKSQILISFQNDIKEQDQVMDSNQNQGLVLNKRIQSFQQELALQENQETPKLISKNSIEQDQNIFNSNFKENQASKIPQAAPIYNFLKKFNNNSIQMNSFNQNVNTKSLSQVKKNKIGLQLCKKLCQSLGNSNGNLIQVIQKEQKYTVNLYLSQKQTNSQRNQTATHYFPMASNMKIQKKQSLYNFQEKQLLDQNQSPNIQSIQRFQQDSKLSDQNLSNVFYNNINNSPSNQSNQSNVFGHSGISQFNDYLNDHNNSQQQILYSQQG
ncbi:hypothetical protein PPERSA_02689 [Pseudocohnilembus persalinus]|uniref:Uncharacterized protein n=1 Tax=Pseudocohnilembus persalinus TaxID=266149 RepID=A0A0V0R5R3_PSEPJ|nr:hypothetical protein PPERSA_02689 [Pseudocohnilembus persalinus]|eukprot:KRX09817.1 hypothetical protein PPERSA_02689 [Pseudocohnilembus persalinus]